MGGTIVKEDTRRHSIKMLRLPVVEERVGYKRTRIYTLVTEGKIPATGKTWRPSHRVAGTRD
jgi:predicted DNA-binding transcriptional regulator AlpA